MKKWFLYWTVFFAIILALSYMASGTGFSDETTEEVHDDFSFDVCTTLDTDYKAFILENENTLIGYAYLGNRTGAIVISGWNHTDVAIASWDGTVYEKWSLNGSPKEVMESEEMKEITEVVEWYTYFGGCFGGLFLFSRAECR